MMNVENRRWSYLGNIYLCPLILVAGPLVSYCSHKKFVRFVFSPLKEAKPCIFLVTLLVTDDECRKSPLELSRKYIFMSSDTGSWSIGFILQSQKVCSFCVFTAKRSKTLHILSHFTRDR